MKIIMGIFILLCVAGVGFFIFSGSGLPLPESGVEGNGSSTNPQDEEVEYTPKTPVRKWEVLDPELTSRGTLLQTLDTDFSFYRSGFYQRWPAASLTKLITAVVVVENIGLQKKIPVSLGAVLTEGVAGGLRAGEVYVAEDLLKILLLTSSNDAAVAFEEFVGGREVFLQFSNSLLQKLSMTETVLFDNSGLSDLNATTPADLLLLAKYILQYHPNIFSITRLPEVLVQPLSSSETRLVTSFNPFVRRVDFLGGKTGTSDVAFQNSLAIFSFHNTQVIAITLGSRDRVGELEQLFQWVDKAYKF